METTGQVLSTPRRIVLGLLFGLSVLYLLEPLWGGLLPARSGESAEPESAADFLLSAQAKYFVGVSELAGQGGLPMLGGSDMLAESIAVSEARDTSALDRLRRLILYEHLELGEGAERMRALLEGVETSAMGEPVASLYRLYLADEPLDENRAEAIGAELGFLGELARLRSYRLDEDPRGEALADSIGARGLRFALVAVFATMAFMGLAFVGFVLLVLFVLFAVAGRVRSAMRRPRTPVHLLLETFTLYLLFMILFHAVGPLIPGPPMALNLLIEFAVPLIALYPLLFGVKPGDLRADLGLHAGSGALKETALGPVGYLAAMPLVIVAALVVYLVSTMTGLDVSEGVHPIAPIVAGGDPWVIVGALLLAVVGAPLIEELMFRGYLYSALRARLGPVASVMLSSAFFAGIHPQGIIGFPLLFTIGAALATLREWRGSLIAPILAHACTNGVSMAILLAL